MSKRKIRMTRHRQTVWGTGFPLPTDEEFRIAREQIRKERVERKPIRLSPWTVYKGYCAMRFVEGTDPNVIANRVAFIEKTARIRIYPFEHNPENDGLNWEYGVRGRTCSHDEDAERAQAYGFYPPSREWCDRELHRLGYVLPDRRPCKGYACDNFSEPEPTGAEFGFCESCQAHDEA